MKRIFTLAIIAVFSVIMLNSCGTAKNMTSTSYVEQGTGVSMNSDIAFEKAVGNAIAKITKAHGVSVDTNENQMYSSTESSRGKGNESINYTSSRNSVSNAKISDYKVIKQKYIYNRFKKKWTCRVTVSVEFENVN